MVDLGRRMNRILDIDEKLAFAVVEPGVSYQTLYDELVRRGNRLMLDVTSGPPQGGMIGNALDKGAGYSPYFDHFGFSCGLEIVLGNGEVLRTGDGTLDAKDLINWHTSKYSFGPILDGLFTQSNYGIVTRMGVWLLPRPPAIRSFHFVFPDDDDLEKIVELCRPLKLSNFVPTLFRVSNDLYLCGSEGESPEYRSSQGRRAISDEGRRKLRESHGLGGWNVSGAFYGPSAAAMEPQIQRVRDMFLQSGKARYISHEDAAAIPSLQVAINAFSGVPSLGELGLLKWRPGGGNIWFLPGTPMDGKVANEFQRLCRGILKNSDLITRPPASPAACMSSRSTARTPTSATAPMPVTASCPRRSAPGVCSSAGRQSTITTSTCGRQCQRFATPVLESRRPSIRTASLRPGVTESWARSRSKLLGSRRPTVPTCAWPRRTS